MAAFNNQLAHFLGVSPFGSQELYELVPGHPRS